MADSANGAAGLRLLGALTRITQTRVPMSIVPFAAPADLPARARNGAPHVDACP